MMKALVALLALTANSYADFKSGDYVDVVGKVIRDRRTGELLGLVQNGTEDSYGFYVLSRDAKVAEGKFKVVYLLKDGFTADQINVMAETAGEAVQDKFGRQYKKAMKKYGKSLWKKFRLDNWEDHKFLGKVWRWPAAIIGFGAGSIADAGIAAGKYVYVLSASAVADLKEHKVEKAMTRVGLAEFDNCIVNVNHKVFRTITAQF